MFESANTVIGMQLLMSEGLRLNFGSVQKYELKQIYQLLFGKMRIINSVHFTVF